MLAAETGQVGIRFALGAPQHAAVEIKANQCFDPVVWQHEHVASPQNGLVKLGERLVVHQQRVNLEIAC